MSDPVVYFGHFKLGDLKTEPENLIVDKTDPTFRGGSGSSRAHQFYVAPASFYEVEVDLEFRRGHLGAETEKAFWRRIRNWQTSLLSTVLPLGNRSLVFVRDPDGAQWGESDQAATVGTYVAGAGNLQLDSLDAGWSVGDYVLIIDANQPAMVNEVVAIEALPGSNQITVTTTLSYNSGSTVLRADWHIPSAVMMGKAEVPVNGEIGHNATPFSMTFRSASDPVEGTST